MPFPVDRRRFGPSLLALGASMTLPLLATGCARREGAPEVSYTLLDGRRQQLSALRDKVVLVNFWATSCVTCVQEMPALAATFRRYSSRGFETLAVAMRHDAPALVASFAESRALPFGIVIDNTGAVAQAFGNVQVTPTSFVIDKRGRIASRFEGAPDLSALHGLLEQLLAEQA